MAEIKLIEAKDAVYGINCYNAINGLQRFQYSYTANEQDLEELGNNKYAATITEPQTSGSFEVTDTGSIASIFARLRYDRTTQKFTAGESSSISTNAFTFTEDDFQHMVFDLIEMKKPGGTFTEAVLIPNTRLTRFSISLNSDGVGSATFDWQGNLMMPIYKPYHKVLSYPAKYLTATTAEIPSAWSVDDTTHGIVGGRINHNILSPTDLSISGNTITLDAGAVARGLSFSADDQIMIWAFAKVPGSVLPIDYPTSIKFVKPDRVDIWLLPAGESANASNRMLRVQSYELSGDITFTEVKEILKNESKTSTFYYAPEMPYNFSGTINILETTLHTWAALQGKTPNESATATTVDTDNILDVTSWQNAKIIVNWYKYGNDDPLQTLTLENVTITGYEGSLSVGGRKEGVWSYKTDGSFKIQGYDLV